MSETTKAEPTRVAFGTVYRTEREIVVVGKPSDCEDENAPEYHNCDAMGCGLEHVVYRCAVANADGAK